MDFLIRNNRRLAIPVGLVAVGVGFAIASLSQNLSADATSTVSLFAFVALIACAVPIVRRVLAGTFDLFEPIVFATAMLAMLCGIRPIITVITGDYVLNERYNAKPFFGQAVLLGLACTVAFVAAYELTSLAERRERRERATSFNLSPKIALQYGVAISAFALILYSLYVRQAGGLGRLLAQRSAALTAAVGNTSEYLSAAPVAIACASILLVLAYKGRLRGRQRLIAIGFALLPALMFAMLGNRRFIIPCVMLPLIVSYLASGKRPRTSRVLVLVPVVFLILATIPYARTEGARQQAGGLTPIYQKSFQDPGETVGRFANGSDTDMLLYLSLQMNYQDLTDHYYHGSATFGDFILAPVPSAVIKDKPATARNDLLVRLFGAPCTNVGGGLCPDFSAIGTFYQDFSWPGAIIGMALMGMGASLLWRRFRYRPGSPYLALLVGITTVYLPIVIRAGLMPAMTWTLYFAIPTAIGIRLARVRVAPRPAPVLTAVPDPPDPPQAVMPA